MGSGDISDIAQKLALAEWFLWLLDNPGLEFVELRRDRRGNPAALWTLIFKKKNHDHMAMLEDSSLLVLLARWQSQQKGETNEHDR